MGDGVHILWAKVRALWSKSDMDDDFNEDDENDDEDEEEQRRRCEQ